jgi:hypothetical protein
MAHGVLACFGSHGKERVMLTAGMVVLGLLTFAALIGFVTLCDRV